MLYGVHFSYNLLNLQNFEKKNQTNKKDDLWNMLYSVSRNSKTIWWERATALLYDLLVPFKNNFIETFVTKPKTLTKMFVSSETGHKVFFFQW